MSEISGVNPNQPLPNVGGARRAAEAYQAGGKRSGDDSVELSKAAQLMAKLSELPDVRQGLVESIGEQIRNGTYDKGLDAKIDALLADDGKLGELAGDLDL